MEIRTKFELGQQVYFIEKGKILCGLIKSVNILSDFDKDFENKKINVTTTYIYYLAETELQRSKLNFTTQ